MVGHRAPNSFQGGMDITYRVGPGMDKGRLTKIQTNNEWELGPVTNVIGVIWGTEPGGYTNFHRIRIKFSHWLNTIT